MITGAYRAVEYIKHNLHLEPGSTKASEADSKKVVAICTKYAQAGMLNIFVTSSSSRSPRRSSGVLLHRLPDRPRDHRSVPSDLHGQRRRRVGQREEGRRDRTASEGTPLHDACVVGDIVGDPFKDTSSVALNPIIKFSTLFGLLAVELAIRVSGGWRLAIATVALAIALSFVYRSFYGHADPLDGRRGLRR